VHVHSVQVTPRVLLVAGVASLALVACSAEPGVVTGGAQQSPTGALTPGPPSTTGTTTPDETAPGDTTPGDTTPSTEPPGSSAPDPTTTPIEDLINEGDAKPDRDYDDFLLLAIDDIQRWWSEQYPALYGDEFAPLRGGVYAAYPERTDPIPGCGPSTETTYEQITEFAAFYCPDGDFLVYDDGEDGVLFSLTDEFGPTILGVVMAHEFGHAIQARSGVLRRDLATIVTEQQADCFAGAWVAHAVSGESDTLQFTDDDVRIGLVAMITVRDPIGVDQFSEGGHGSAFDRVGAFQVGFGEGVERCAELVDDPLPLVPNVLQPDGNPEGNSTFGYGDDEIVGLITNDLNEFWPPAVAAEGGELTSLAVVPIESANEIECEDPAGDVATGAVYCAATHQVYLDEPFAVQLYERFGDFVVGYVLGGAWSEAVQQALASPLAGEDRALLSDCLTGAWTSDLIPDAQGNTTRNNAEIEAGDLDEAIRTALLVGDESSTADVLGSGFEKIASFREGVLGGIDACTDQLPD
jgi:predicted metalloprotease